VDIYPLIANSTHRRGIDGGKEKTPTPNLFHYEEKGSKILLPHMEKGVRVFPLTRCNG